MTYRFMKREAKLSLRKLLPGVFRNATPEQLAAFESLNVLRRQLLQAAKFTTSLPHI